MFATLSFMTMAAARAQDASTTAAPSFCILEAEGHPTVDLNPLALTDQDYSVGSHYKEGFDYVLNVCSNLNYQDDTCHEGSSICQRHKKSSMSTDVFGYTGSISLGWEDPDGIYTYNSSIVMRMTGTACGMTNNETESETTVNFICSNREFLMLEKENPETCKVSLLFFTAQACGAPRYSCFNGTKCVESPSGEFGEYETCSASCGVSNAERYACVEGLSGFQCTQKPDGPFTDFGTCTTDCAKVGERR